MKRTRGPREVKAQGAASGRPSKGAPTSAGVSSIYRRGDRVVIRWGDAFAEFEVQASEVQDGRLYLAGVIVGARIAVECEARLVCGRLKPGERWRLGWDEAS